MTWTRILLAAICLAAMGTPAAGKQVIDTSDVETEEGDLYTLTYDSMRSNQGHPDPKVVFDLVYDQGDTILAIMGDTAKWNGTVTLSRKYFSDLDNCDWVTDTYVAVFKKGKAHGTWRHTERYCEKIWIADTAVYTDGVRTAGKRLSNPAPK